MIGDFEHIAGNTNFPPECKQRGDLIGIKHLIFVDPDYSFATEEDFQDPDIWRTAVIDGDIHTLLHNRQTDNISTPTQEGTSDQGFLYKIDSGKYRFLLYYDLAYDFALEMKKFSESGYKIMFVDLKGNTIAYTPDGTTIEGFESDVIYTEKMDYGVGNVPNWTKIVVELSEAEQLDEHAITTKQDWNYTRTLTLVPVDVVNVQAGSLTFQVVEQLYSSPVNGLNAGDIIINDDTGTYTFNTFRALGNGNYFIDDFSGSLTFGNIVIDAINYYGSGIYIVTTATVELNNFSYESETKVTFDVRNIADDSLVTGLIVGNFTVTDDINGSLSIGGFSEVSTGRYELSSLSGNLTTGDIDVSSASYTGSTAYDLDIDVTVYDFEELDPALVAQKIMSVKRTITGLAVSGLIAGDFSLEDEDSGTVSVISLSESPSGTYNLTFDKGLTAGVITISASDYSGDTNYSYIGANWRNGGGTGTTDWLNPTDGLAEYWDQAVTPSTALDNSIVTGNGFTGNAQRVELSEAVSGGDNYLRGSAVFFRPSTDYQLNFKYRSSHEANINLSGVSLDEDFTISVNTSNATTYTSVTFTTGANEGYLEVKLSFLTTVIGSYFEMDEIELIEV